MHVHNYVQHNSNNIYTANTRTPDSEVNPSGPLPPCSELIQKVDFQAQCQLWRQTEAAKAQERRTKLERAPEVLKWAARVLSARRAHWTAEAIDRLVSTINQTAREKPFVIGKRNPGFWKAVGDKLNLTQRACDLKFRRLVKDNIIQKQGNVFFVNK